RQRALGEPGLHLFEVELEPLGLLLRQQRIEVAEPLDETPVARAAAVGDHDVIERPLLGARAGKTQFQGHFRSFPQLTLSSRPSEASARTQLASFACVARWVPARPFGPSGRTFDVSVVFISS